MKHFLVTQIYGPFGHPTELLSDAGPEFKKHFDQACTELQVKRHRSVAYHSKGHGKVERFHSTLLLAIAKFIPFEDKKLKKPWVEATPHALLAYNSAVHSALSQGRTGISPGEVFSGRKLKILPLE